MAEEKKEQKVTAVFIRDTTPQEGDVLYVKDQVVEMSPESFSRWEKREAVKLSPAEQAKEEAAAKAIKAEQEKLRAAEQREANKAAEKREAVETEAEKREAAHDHQTEHKGGHK